MLSEIENIGSKNFEKYLRQINEEVYPYGNATHAYVDILLHLNKENPSEHPNIVLPSFIPAKLYRVTLAAGYKPLFYEIDTCCNFNPSDAEMLIDKDTKCIFGVHYFGHPADMLSLRKIADHYNIPLIEDCAHVLFGESNRMPLGTFGDYRIFSVRKMLVLSDGGYLGLNYKTKNFKPNYKGNVNSIYTASKVLPSRMKFLYFNLTGGSDILHLAKIPDRGYIDFTRKSKLNIKRISTLSSLISKSTDIKKHVEIRRENYSFLINALREFKFLKPLFDDLPALWTPYSLPVLVLTGDRDLLQSELLKFGISCGCGWPESPFSNNLPKTKILSKNIIEFPVHPFITKGQLNYIVAGCSSFEKQMSRSSNENNQRYFENSSLQVFIPQHENSIKSKTIELSTQIIEDNKIFDCLKEQWNMLCENAEVHIFQTFEWQNIWWKHYGKNKKLHIIMFYHNSKLVGIAPLFIDKFQVLGLTIFKRIRLLGSSVEEDTFGKVISNYSVSDYLDLIVHNDYKEIFAQKLVDYLINNYTFYDTIQFDDISDNSYIYKYIIPRLQELKWDHKIIKGEICPRIIVPSSVSDFMKGLKSKIRYQLSKIKRDISSSSQFELKKIQDLNDLDQGYNEFVRLHQQRWNSQGLPGAFIDNRFTLFLKDTTEAFLQNDWLNFTSIYSNENCLAVECAFKFKNYYYDYLKAFDDLSPLSKYRPGRALLLFLIEEAINNKISVVDMLRGSEPYKFEIASESHWIYNLTISNPAFSLNIRFAVYFLIISVFKIRRHFIKETSIMKAQIKNFGINGLTSHYIPMTFKRIKNKVLPLQYSTQKLHESENSRQNKLETSEDVVKAVTKKFSGLAEKQ